jgi:hypothetical protein
LLDWVLLPPALYTTFPAGWGVLTPMMAQRLRKSGLKQGIPDVLIWFDGRTIGIELKAGKNTVTEAQRDMHQKLAAAGVAVHVCKTLDSVLYVLRSERLPLRPTNGSGFTTTELQFNRGEEDGRAQAGS